ncbi:HmuY family protein [Flavobacterium sp. MAH-1]|uniref:HmuY family protein n=1 Tax=Flavobacterium agri TaxID=2743471 RepID=A0A7Y9C6Y6_9FLAO|nr:HmuY family protein [Flavobacterium agri]NUY80854.1 HmuY family protein [Flavobacterium agri]NYA70878.1 HmuY family protein [Flavobacterium agri]
MMKKLLLFFVLFAGFFAGCESEDQIADQPFVVAFEKRSYDYSRIPQHQTVKLVFSESAKADGFVRIRITTTNAEMGVDFDISDATENHELLIPIYRGQTEAGFVFENLIYPFDSDDKSIKLDIIAIDYPQPSNIQGYTSTLISFERSLGATTAPEIGGPNEGNQVYFDLSSETATQVWRDSWDLGFYCGDEFRVGINGSIYMAVKKLDVTNIDAVTESSVSQYQSQVSVGTFNPDNAAYIDYPSGQISGTAISEISSDNHVYLVNLGYTVGTTTPAPGSVAIAGEARGWRKIKVIREGEGYKLQYAELNSATHQEVSIAKNPAYNFTFFSFNTNSTVNVEPEKDKWDLNFTVFTNIIDGAGSYGYSDFVLNNIKAGIKAYRINVSGSVTYDNFDLADVNDASFQDDQRVIGADWRDVFSGSAYTDRFYVLKDSDGNYYKIRMLAFLNQNGMRGYPKFEYRLLQ